MYGKTQIKWYVCLKVFFFDKMFKSIYSSLIILLTNKFCALTKFVHAINKFGELMKFTRSRN